MRPPRGVALPALLAVAFLALPLAGLVVRAPWGTMAEELAAPEIRSALFLSLVCSIAATALSLAFGLPLAWCLARFEFRGRGLVRALVMLPAVIPPVVGGVALLMAFGRRGLVGAWLDRAFGISIPFTTAAAILAETYVAIPFLVFACEAGFRSVDRRQEEAAATLGARPWHSFLRVTLPLAAPAIGAGIALCWARALGEFGATITFAGSFPGRTQTMPLAILLALESRPEGAIALSLLLLAASLSVLVLLGRRASPFA